MLLFSFIPNQRFLICLIGHWKKRNVQAQRVCETHPSSARLQRIPLPSLACDTPGCESPSHAGLRLPSLPQAQGGGVQGLRDQGSDRPSAQNCPSSLRVGDQPFGGMCY